MEGRRWRIGRPLVGFALLLLSGVACEPPEPEVVEKPLVRQGPEVTWDDNGAILAWAANLSGSVQVEVMLQETRLELESNVDGPLWIGSPDNEGRWSWEGTLTPGAHIFTLRVRDVRGQELESSVSAEVRTNVAPVCQIVSPIEGETYQRGESIWFSVESRDEDGDSLSSFWYSSVEGRLFEGQSWERVLNEPGEHIISVEVEDAYGEPCWSEVGIVVE